MTNVNKSIHRPRATATGTKPRSSHQRGLGTRIFALASVIVFFITAIAVFVHQSDKEHRTRALQHASIEQESLTTVSEDNAVRGRNAAMRLNASSHSTQQWLIAEQNMETAFMLKKNGFHEQARSHFKIALEHYQSASRDADHHIEFEEMRARFGELLTEDARKKLDATGGSEWASVQELAKRATESASSPFEGARLYYTAYKRLETLLRRVKSPDTASISTAIEENYAAVAEDELITDEMKLALKLSEQFDRTFGIYSNLNDGDIDENSLAVSRALTYVSSNVLASPVAPTEPVETSTPRRIINTGKPIDTGGVVIDVFRIKHRKDVDVQWWNLWGGYIKDFKRQLVLRIGVRNMNNSARTLDVETLFVARNLSSNELVLFNESIDRVSLGKGDTVKLYKYSSELEARVTRRVYPYSDSTTGHRIEGHIVRVLENGRVLSSKGSTKYLENDGYDDRKVLAWRERGKQAFGGLDYHGY